MGVVTKYGTAAKDPSVLPAAPLPAEITQGHVKSLISTVAIKNGDSATSVVHFGQVPATARPVDGSTLACTAITGLTDFDLGDANTKDALVNGATLAAAAKKDALADVALGNMGKTFYELLGYTENPGGMLDIFGTLNAAATADGTIALTLLYATP